MDAYAWIEYLDGSPRGARVRDHIENRVAITAVESNSTLHTISPALATLAGEVHAEEKKRKQDFGLADAFVLATARSRSSKVLTGDPHFKDVPEAVMI